MLASSGGAFFVALILLPSAAIAFSLSNLWPTAQASSPVFLSITSNISVLQAAVNSDPNPTKGVGDIAIAGGVALLSQVGPEGTIADIIDAASSNQISIYVVRSGDSLGRIAKMYGVSTNTILWANDLKSAKDIYPGDTLVILPVSGVEHVVVKGETLAGIVKKYRGDMRDVLDYNNLTLDAKLAVGDTIIIPDGIDAPAPSSVSSSGTKVGSVERLLPGYGGPAIPSYFTRPIAGGIKTQGLHGYNAVDLGTPRGTPVMTAAEGIVIVSRSSGYNGGYGQYIVVNHPNGTQTVYAHLSKTLVTPGTYVVQGQVIALSGNSGRSTGSHLHFEVRGAANPF
ncbi:MAG: peptidoglycan DD-metalloendopeptidase family protein [bacterium]|nr:peptidoglycan DD-metalloendopeptidase family protein [bacterium]